MEGKKNQDTTKISRDGRVLKCGIRHLEGHNKWCYLQKANIVSLYYSSIVIFVLCFYVNLVNLMRNSLSLKVTNNNIYSDGQKN